MDIYETCPILSGDRFLLRQVAISDRDDLLKVYSDPAAVPIFNSDNCTGDFYMTRPQDMENCIAFWLREYAQRYYVRWSIVDRDTGSAVGTIELFHRTAEDFFSHVVLLRLDLRSDYETGEALRAVLSVLFPTAFDLFDCTVMATKIPPCAQVRRDTLTAMGFRYSPEKLYGHNGTAYGDYFLLNKEDLA